MSIIGECTRKRNAGSSPARGTKRKIMDIYELLFPLFKRYLKLKLNRDSLENSVLGLYADMKGDIIES